MKNEVGLKQIAFELGLSIAAVSRALKDYNDISEETKRKVRKKAIEYGYIPKSLKKSDKKTIAILVDSLGSSFFGIIAEKMIEEFKKHNCLVHFISTAQNFASKENIKEAIELSSDGIISFLLPHEDAYEIALLYNIPILLFGRYVEKEKLNIVYMDDFHGGELAASYLIEQGARKLCYIGVNDIECSFRREKGFISGGLNNGIHDIRIIYNVENVDCVIEEGYNWIFCFDDSLANYLLNSQKGKEVHVVGFNGISKYLPQFDFFTSIFANYDLMIRDAVTILIEKIYNQNAGNAIIIKHTTELC